MNGKLESVAVPDPAILGARFTAAFLVVLLLAVGAWDVYAEFRWGSRATVSNVLHGWVQDYPIIALVFGLLAGHICWPLK
jgi:hypothetical protein